MRENLPRRGRLGFCSRALRRFWGWGLAAVLVATQTVGSVVNAILGDFWEGATGSILAAATLCFLLRPQVRTAFRSKAFPDHRIG